LFPVFATVLTALTGALTADSLTVVESVDLLVIRSERHKVIFNEISEKRFTLI
jgi:hypothetical protein